MDDLLEDADFAASELCTSLRAAPLGFVDVGARDGVHELVWPLAGATAVLGFEPDPEECARLNAATASGSPWAACAFEPVALVAEEGIGVLHVLTAPTNSSLRPPNPALTARYEMVKWRPVARRPVPTTTLDAVLFGRRANEAHWGEMLKLDTQGTEYEILAGARRTLAERTVVVVTEVSFCELYQGQRLFSEVELLLRATGFSFYGFTTMHHRSRRALDKRREAGRERPFQADAVFFRDPLPGGPSGPARGARGRQVVFVAALLLGYHDFALELVRDTWAGFEAERLAAVVHRRAALRPEAELADVLVLAARMRADPVRAPVELGRFVDRRRARCDYDDVPQASGR